MLDLTVSCFDIGEMSFFLIVKVKSLTSIYRRMRYRFRELIASHYSSATGHATINHHGLMLDDDDDDESPIIRGFNDKEPLVA